MTSINAVRLELADPRVDEAALGRARAASPAGARGVRRYDRVPSLALDSGLGVPPPGCTRAAMNSPAVANGVEGGDCRTGGSGGLLLRLVMEHLLFRGMAGTAAALAREVTGAGGGRAGALLAEGQLAAAALRQRVMQDVQEGEIVASSYWVLPSAASCGLHCGRV